ncbi:hypothetical protein CVT26_013048 [Gymnopilus dilepis]|uniref:HAT C-terminal dimerisation domain-containing protein n=1 Tax=Gymnopilus dilepis TaxID=231916 RepID=A0A409X0J2_9AGAR|nr:hypothetical protein CVT26_013048 [Gymnopilus dilepis]
MSAPGASQSLSGLSTSHAEFFCKIASSCDVERAFSRGGLNVSKLRHALSDESTRASTVVNSWSEFPELIPAAKIVELFQDKQSRLGKQKQPANKSTDDEVVIVDSPEDSMDIENE